MRKKLLLFVSCLLLAGGYAQHKPLPNPGPVENRPANNLNLSLFGDVSIIAFNYERLFGIREKNFFTWKLGFGYNEEFQLCWGGPCSAFNRYLALPHHITANFGVKRHFLETGLGGTWVNGNPELQYYSYPIIGYRLMPLQSGRLNMRVYGMYPFSGLEKGDMFIFPFGISLGYSFK